MAHNNRTFLPLLIFILIICSSSVVSGFARCFPKTMNQPEYLGKVRTGSIPRNSRKLLDSEIVQADYSHAGANPRHDPGRGRGGGSRN